MKKLLVCALVGAVALAPMHLAEARACPALADGVRVFPDHTIGVVGKLEVDTDGAAASYSPGNHGFSYIVDGVDRLDGDKISACSTDNQAACNATDARLAEMDRCLIEQKSLRSTKQKLQGRNAKAR